MKTVTDTKRLTSLFIDHENYDWLKSESSRTGLTMAEIIRRSVAMTREVAKTLGGAKAA